MVGQVLAICLTIACSTPQAPKNGDVSIPVSNNLIATYTCNDGYMLNGVRVSLCIDGKWTKEAPTCKGM